MAWEELKVVEAKDTQAHKTERGMCTWTYYKLKQSMEGNFLFPPFPMPLKGIMPIKLNETI